jgi:hypothetical protein
MKNKLFILGVSLVLLFAFSGCREDSSCFTSATGPTNVVAQIFNPTTPTYSTVVVTFNAASDALQYEVLARVRGSRTIFPLDYVTNIQYGVVSNQWGPGLIFGAPLQTVDANVLFARFITDYLELQLAANVATTHPIEFGVRAIGLGGIEQGPSSIVWSTAVTLNVLAQNQLY